MARYVIDAPTLLRIVTDDVVVAASHQLVAPGSIRSEAMALLLDDVRRGTLTEAEALDRHERFTGIKMRLLNDRVSRRTAWALARDHHWTMSEAEYVAVCKLQADALVTVDENLAAKADGVVPLAPFETLLTE